jgi:hypothetical protein
MIIRIYKVAGLLALTAILFGLIGVVVVNVYYLFDDTWVRPVVLSPTHQKVVQASTLLADAKLRSGQLETENLEIEVQLVEIARTVAMTEALMADLERTVDKPRTADQWLVHRELERTKLARDNAVGRRALLQQRLETSKLRKAEQDAVIHRLETSPYLRAVRQKVVLAFVPYQNLATIKIGTRLYGCAWGLIACSNVGKVTTVLDGEVQEVHPHDDTMQRGVMVEVDVATAAVGASVLFAGGRPLWLF